MNVQLTTEHLNDLGNLVVAIQVVVDLIDVHLMWSDLSDDLKAD